MLLERRAALARNVFYAGAGDPLLHLLVNVGLHDRAPFSLGSSALRPRYRRDLIVPTGEPVTSAISSRVSPSWKRRTTVSRYSGAIPLRPANTRSLSSWLA